MQNIQIWKTLCIGTVSIGVLPSSDTLLLRWPWPDCTDAQTDLDIRFPHIPRIYSFTWRGAKTWVAKWVNEPSVMCAQRRLKSACASAKLDRNLRCPHKDTLHPWLSKLRQVKILIRLRECDSRSLIWIFTGRTCQQACFLTLRFNYFWLSKKPECDELCNTMLH